MLTKGEGTDSLPLRFLEFGVAELNGAWTDGGVLEARVAVAGAAAAGAGEDGAKEVGGAAVTTRQIPDLGPRGDGSAGA